MGQILKLGRCIIICAASNPDFTNIKGPKQNGSSKHRDLLSRFSGGLFPIKPIGKDGTSLDRLCIVAHLMRRRLQALGVWEVPIGLLLFLCKVPVQHEARSIESIINLLRVEEIKTAYKKESGELEYVFASMLEKDNYDHSPLRFHIAEVDRETALALWKELSSHMVPIPIAEPPISAYAQAYETLRHGMPSGPDRTLQMLTIANQVRALAKKMEFTSSEICDLFKRGLEGNRIIALECLIDAPSPDCFKIVLNATNHSKSAFEQSAALRAAERMLPSLNDGQKQQLKTAIEDQRSGGEGKFIRENEDDRWLVSGRILDAIEKT
jgi:hypothetical protein